MAPVIHQLQKYAGQLESRVCITAQHRQMLDQTLAIFQIQPDIDLNLMQPEQTLADLTSRVITEVSRVLDGEKPDLLLVQGDTTTVMGAALAAFYQKIAVGHIEAGLRTGDPYSPFPEEVNRRMASVLATYHFAPTLTAVEALRAEGVAAEKIYCTGNTVVDALLWTASQKPSEFASCVLNQLGFLSQTNNQKKKKRILVTAHRRENFGAPLQEICWALLAIVERNPEVELIYPVHLNPKVQEPVYRILSRHERIHLIEPLSYEPFVHLMRAVDLILTDSGGIQEEAPVFGKPVLVLRNETERPEAVAAGTVKLVGAEPNLIINETEKLLQDETAYAAMANATSPYGDGHAADRIVEVVLGLTEKSFPVLAGSTPV